MGKLMGAYDSDELDRPDLNQCPDCGCYFATDECPLCGKVCPEEMRAGHRAVVKKKKKPSGGYTGRVQFIPWYHSWWFIAIMLWWMFPVGVVLFFSAPYSKKTKIILTSVAAVLVVAFYGGVYLYTLGLFDRPLVNDDIPREEYVALCEDMSAEDFHRYCESERYVRMELTVVRSMEDMYDGYTYYVCTDRGGGTYKLLLRDCLLEGDMKFLSGDMIRVFGECGGTAWVRPTSGNDVQLPCLNIAYGELIG